MRPKSGGVGARLRPGSEEVGGAGTSRRCVDCVQCAGSAPNGGIADAGHPLTVLAVAGGSEEESGKDWSELEEEAREADAERKDEFQDEYTSKKKGCVIIRQRDVNRRKIAYAAMRSGLLVVETKLR